MKSAFGVEASCFSTLGSEEIEAVPFYCGDHLDNRLVYNFWSDGLE